MIYGAALGPFVKKALGEKGFQTNVKKMIETLPLDPAVSNMDAIVLGPKDMRGSLGLRLNEAIQERHPSVGVVYFYQKEKDTELIQGDVKKVKANKVNPEGIQDAINSIIEIRLIGSDHRVLESADKKVQDASLLETVLLPPEPPHIPEEPYIEPEADFEPEPTVLLAEVEVAVAEEPYVEPYSTLEARVAEMGKFGDFNFFKKSLQKDTILRELMVENTQYASLMKMLELLDQQIIDVFKDTSLTADERFEKLKALGIDRAAYKGLESSIVADKIMSIMVAIMKSAEETVDARIAGVRQALDSVASVKLVYQDQSRLQSLIESRLQVQMDLMELSKGVIEVYQAMDQSVSGLLEQFEAELPSNNDYINAVMNPLKPIFTPSNIGALTTKILGDLQQNRVSLSIMEEKIKSLINLVFKLCEEDATIIEYQQKLINLLLSQRVEDVVIVDSVIKNSLRIFVGPEDTGRTATALTWAGVVSRRQNTLLLDLTGESKLRQYGVEPMVLDTFLEQRLEQQFVCVEGNLNQTLERVDEVVAELKTRLNYYAHIHVILDAGQSELLSRLAPSALSVHFITDGTMRGTKLLKQTIESFTEENIAKKVILIDPPIDPVRMMQDLSIDPLLAKLIIIPHLPYIRACAYNHTKPYENKEVMAVFEEAFR